MILLKNDFLCYFFAVLLLTTPVTHAMSVGKCEGLFLSSTVKKFSFEKHLINQEDVRFIKYNLLTKEQSSQLCGITSLANFINFKLYELGRAMEASDLVKFISEVSINYMLDRRTNGDRNFSIMGMYSFELADLAELLIKQLKLPFKVLSKSILLDDGKITALDFLNNQGLIWSLQFVKNQNKELGASHFIFVISYDPATQRIAFSDPLEPELIKTARLSFPQHQFSQPIRIDLDEGTNMKKLTGFDEGHFDLSGIIAIQSK